MSFYTRFAFDPSTERFGAEELDGYENTTLFLVSVFQCLTLCVVYSSGRPWRNCEPLRGSDCCRIHAESECEQG